jgi:guanylate kinase
MRLTESYPQFIHRVITCTTRPPRVGEIDGEDYYFLTRQEFEAQYAEGKFLEKAVVHHNLYGCRKQDIAKHLSAGYDALLNVDVQGAASIRNQAESDKSLAESLVTVFVRVTDPVELRRRLTGRGTDPVDEIDRRVAASEYELQHAGHYQHVIESGPKEADFLELNKIYLHEKKSRV